MSRVKTCRARGDFAKVVGLRMWNEFSSWLPIDRDDPNFDWPWKDERKFLLPEFIPILRAAWERYWDAAQRMDAATYKLALEGQKEITRSGYSRIRDAATIKDIIRNIWTETLNKGDDQCTSFLASY